MDPKPTISTIDPRHASPHLGLVALAYVILKIASVFPVSAFGSKPPWFPALNAPVSQVVAYFGMHSFRVLLCAFLQMGAAIPFGIFAASAASRLRFLGATAAGTYIAFFGGVMAAMDEFWSGAVIAVMAQPIVTEEAPPRSRVPLPVGRVRWTRIHNAIRLADGGYFDRRELYEIVAEMGRSARYPARACWRAELAEYHAA
jgi:hypothetical protein